MRLPFTCAVLIVSSLSGCFSDEIARVSSNAGATASDGGRGETAGSNQAGGAARGGAANGGAGEAGAPAAGANLGGSSGSSDGGAPAAGAPFVLDKSKPALISVGGQVLSSTNGFGVQGTWAVFKADTAQVTGSFTGTNVCVTGNYPRVPNDSQWPNYWGGGISLILNSATPGGPALPYDAPAHSFAGVAVTVAGSKIPHEIRLKFKQVGSTDSYCKAFQNVKSGDRLRVLVSDVSRDCWNPGGPKVAATSLEHFELHVWPEIGAVIEMDLCLSDLSVIALGDENVGTGGMGGTGGASAGSGGTGGASAGSAGASAGAGGVSAGSGGAGSGGATGGTGGS